MTEEEKPNSFKRMIKGGVIKRADSGMQIRFADIHVKPGFNRRRDDERLEESINDLVAYMLGGGEVPALEVYARDGGGVWIVEGHRRHRAYERAIAAGKPVEWIKITQFVGSDAERVARIATSNSQLPLTPLELASVYRELRGFNWSSSEIAQRMGKKKDHVDRILALADSNTDVQLMVAKGEVAATVAVQHVKAHGEKAGEVLADKLEQAKAEGKAKVSRSTGKPKGPAALRGMTWKAQGDASSYVLMRDDQWIAAIQMNGALNVFQHESILTAIAPQDGPKERVVDENQLELAELDAETGGNRG